MPISDRVQDHPVRYLGTLRADVRAGLTATPKTLPPKYFYDERGPPIAGDLGRAASDP